MAQTTPELDKTTSRNPLICHDNDIRYDTQKVECHGASEKVVEKPQMTLNVITNYMKQKENDIHDIQCHKTMTLNVISYEYQ